MHFETSFTINENVDSSDLSSTSALLTAFKGTQLSWVDFVSGKNNL